VVRPDGTDCDPGELGEILVKGPLVISGYWENEEATKEAFRDGWFHSGDLGSLDETGNLQIVDRLKDLIISGGYNIAPAEIENAIAAVPGVIEVCVIATPDERFGETPTAIVHGTEGLT
jgi:fatty-acyl-CoA synthase